MVSSDPPHPHQVALKGVLSAESDLILFDLAQLLVHGDSSLDLRVSDDFIKTAVEKASGIVLSGDDRVGAPDYEALQQDQMGGADRKLYAERAILKHAIELGIPVLGICRGCQLINNYLGGSLERNLGEINGVNADHYNTQYEDLPQELGMSKQAFLLELLTDTFGDTISKGLETHKHEVTVMEGTVIHNAMKGKSPMSAASGTIEVVSLHTQGILPDGLAPDLRIVAQSDDGVVEAVAHKDLPIFGCQFHPELDRTTADLFLGTFANYVRYHAEERDKNPDITPASMPEWAGRQNLEPGRFQNQWDIPH